VIKRPVEEKTEDVKEDKVIQQYEEIEESEHESLGQIEDDSVDSNEMQFN